MKLLMSERTTLEQYLPGLDKALAETPFLELESPSSAGIRLFRELGGPRLLIPQEYSGSGASPLEAIHIQRAIASRSPSLAIATTMHHFSVATLVEICSQSEGLEGLLLEAIAQQKLLLASGFAEGQSGRGILAPTMRARRTDKGVVVSGSKKPCSLTWSMDLLTASVTLPSDDASTNLAVILIPVDSVGIERKKFWGNPVLAGAESDEVILHDVLVPERLIFHTGSADNLDSVQVSGFIWFELLISASYLGVASALVERTIIARRGEPGDRALLGMEVEGAMAALEGVARAMMAGQRGHNELARMLFVRYAVEQALARASAFAVELLGGLASIRSSEISYLYTAARALAFHPPSRISMAQPLADSLAGAPLKMQ